MPQIATGAGSQSNPNNDGGSQNSNAGASSNAQGGDGGAGNQNADANANADQSQSPDDLIGGMSFDDLDRVLNTSAEDLENADTIGGEGQDTVTAGNDDETFDGEDDGDDDENGDGDDTIAGAGQDDGTKKAKNYRFNKVEDPKKQHLLRLLRQNPDSDPIELARLAGYTAKDAAAAVNNAENGEGGTGAGQQQQQRTEIPPTLKPLHDKVDGLKAKIAEKREAIRTAQAAYEPTAVLVSELSELVGELTDANGELRLANRDYAEEAEWQAEWQADNAQAKKQAGSKYPEVGDKNSVHYALVKQEVAALEAENPRAIDDPNFPLLIIQRLEKKHPGIFNKAGQQQQQQGNRQQQGNGNRPPAKGARPIGSQVAGNRGTQEPLAGAELEKAIENMDLDSLEALANEVGTKPQRKGPR